ncbi:NAD(P)-binding protein [Arsenicibacter rosenii]|uniref:FAD-dependent oxidoreductase n=1 Tax=Arsenicibacter rosenii TaxID=1750698 RepID=A0A1S2VLS3_9BACT|nr:NAD(P)/FAD-dependent oxidoreductase [Arsenicibacter rosenii]OIN59712.1 FAD-dependent oxidoreductase [Arsenicibacter rosenii]
MPHSDDTTRTSRRQFLEQTVVGTAALLSGSLALDGCAATGDTSHITGQLAGPNHRLGHLLRDATHGRWALPDTPFTVPSVEPAHEADILIVGGGIAGLSARRWLEQQGVRNVLLIELEEETGGNAQSGENPVSPYPLGAHYLPIPDVRNRELLDFLQQADVITGFSPEGLPVYNDYHLCHDPEERLLIKGHWQEGLLPAMGVPADEQAQISRFVALTDKLKAATGADGRDVFAIPVAASSTDPEWQKLDTLSFEEYLAQHGFTSPCLRWYLAYACKDDYGTNLANTSAWAGLHYFASRKGKAANASASSVLTWPEGNAFLAAHLRRQARSPILTGWLAHSIRRDTDRVYIKAFSAQTQQPAFFSARQVILATPQFITQRLINPVAPDRQALTADFQYAPWLVANLTVTALPQERGMPLCWDNVIYGSDSVGYVVAQHQSLQPQSEQQVITLYWPLTNEAPDLARRKAYQTPYADWKQMILAELEQGHPGVTAYVSDIQVWIWGHGMIAPQRGFITGQARQQAAQPIAGQLFFAHSDLSGMSIFEEAFYQGIRAAKEVLKSRNT